MNGGAFGGHFENSNQRAVAPAAILSGDIMRIVDGAFIHHRGIGLDYDWVQVWCGFRIPFVRLSMVFRITFDLLSFVSLIFMDELVSAVENGWR